MQQATRGNSTNGKAIVSLSNARSPRSRSLRELTPESISGSEGPPSSEASLQHLVEVTDQLSKDMQRVISTQAIILSRLEHILSAMGPQLHTIRQYKTHNENLRY